MQGGKSIAKAQQSILAGLAKGMSVIGERTGTINSLQFYQTVVDSLTAHLPSDDLIQLLRPLEKSSRPQKHEELVLFGETEVHMMAKLLGEPTREAMEDFREFKLQGTQEGETLKRLLIASKIYLSTSS